MAKVILGKVAISWKGVYDNSTTYHNQDVVQHNSQCYICTVDNTTGITPPNTNYWEIFSQSGLGTALEKYDLIYKDANSLVQRLPIGTDQSVLGIDLLTGSPAWQGLQFKKGSRVRRFANDLGHDCIHTTCYVIDTNDKLRSWGNNGYYQLGSGPFTGNACLPLHVAFPQGFPGISKLYTTYALFTGAIDNQGKWWIWGNYSNGRPGMGINFDVGVPVCISNSPDDSIYGQTIVESFQHYSDDDYYNNMLLDSDGDLHFVGYNGYYKTAGSVNTEQLYYICLTDDSKNPTPLASGITYFLDNTYPVQLAAGEKIAKISSNGENQYTSFFAITTEGRILSWGYGEQGQRADGSTAAQLTTNGLLDVTDNFTDDGGTTIYPIKQIYGAPHNYYAVDENDGLWSWGHNGNGQCANGTTTETLLPTRCLFDATTSPDSLQSEVDGSDISKKVKYVFYNTDRGARVFGIVTQDNKVYTCGRNQYYGTLHSTGASNSSLLKRVVELDGLDIVKIACIGGNEDGSVTTAFLTSDNRVFIGGRGSEGQIGDGMDVDSGVVEINTFGPNTKIVDLHGFGYYNTGTGFCFLNDDGRLFYCGSGTNMKSGDDDNTHSYTPQEILF